MSALLSLHLPTSWQVTPTIDGAVIDTEHGRIVHVAGAPLVAARDLVATRLAWRPRFTITAVERDLTAEGELAVIATATSGDEAIAWGIAYADDTLAFYELSGPRTAPLRELVARCARAHRFALGLRWRRFRYTPPPGWDALARGLITDWLAPWFPARWAVLTVYPAFPTSASTVGIVPSLIAGATAQGLVIAREAPLEPMSDHGLTGVGTRVEGTLGAQRVRVEIAAFLDDRYVYAVELQSRAPEGWDLLTATLADLLRSIEPIPRPKPGSFQPNPE